MEKNNEITLQSFITEETLCQMLNINAKAFGALRRSPGLPFSGVNQNVRLYLERDVIEWLLSRRKVTGGLETE